MEREEIEAQVSDEIEAIEHAARIETEQGRVVRSLSGEEYELKDGEWQCGECDRIHTSPCQACVCLTGEDECDCPSTVADRFES